MRPKKIILCVDDNEQELSVLKFMLATNGYRVVSANNGQEAIGMFSDHAVDLVLSDYAMPQMNGDQLVNRLKQMASHVPMILLGDPQKMGDQLHGADALLAKKNLLSAGIARTHQDHERPQARPPQRNYPHVPDAATGGSVVSREQGTEQGTGLAARIFGSNDLKIER